MKEYNKLVRDKIPQIIKGSGITPVTHTAGDEEYERALGNKLLEEVDEFRKSGDLEELADIQEVIDAIAQFKGLTREDINRLKEEKAERRGAFSKRIILERTE